MNSDIPLAFDSLQARALANSGAEPRDRISLREHVVEVEIGAFQVERGTTQRVQFDVVVEVSPSDASLTDDVDKILSYDNITESIATELASGRMNLLETLAERIAGRILEKPKAEKVYVRIQKLDRGPGALGVEIVRDKARALPGDVSDAVEQPRPTLVFLSAGAVSSPSLPQWLDELERAVRPVIVCVAPPEGARLRAATKEAQERIDLLAIEQNAWILSSRDSRCVVVGTRTELDWGMRNGQISVWAPSHMIVDASDPPSADAAALANWLAAQLNAAELVVVGAQSPADPSAPIREIKLDSATLL